MKKIVNAALGLIIGGVLLWLLFRDTQWSAVGDAIRRMHWGWFLLAQIPLWGVFFIRVQRWSYIVRAAQPASFKDLFNATQIGFLANFVLPARLGELILCMLVSILAFQPASAIVLPRETFGTDEPITFAPELYRQGAWGIGIVLVVVIGINALLFLKRDWVIAISDATLGRVARTLAQKVRDFIHHFADGLDIFRKPWEFTLANLYSIGVWACAIAMFYCMLRAFDIDAPWYTPFVMQTILGVFISAPAAPGFVGTFHMPLVITIAMTVPGESMDTAKAFALICHIIQLPPVIVYGVYSLISTRLSLGSLAREGSEMAEKQD
jgi:glycosyltransferase 2 family protein